MPAAEIDIKRKDERVILLMSMLVAEEWKPGVTERELAEQWSLSKAGVLGLRADALRMLRLSMGSNSREQMRDLISLRLHEVYAMARENKDSKGAVAALKLAAQLSGTLIHRHEISAVEQVREELSGKSDDELEAEIDVLRLKAVNT